IVKSSYISFEQELRFQQGAKNLESDYDSGWSLFDRFGTKDFNPLFIFFLLIAFAILVAPVNLFYFAKAGRRHRLFITTPIISVATCLLIVAVIFFMDGVGGSGMRVVLADLQPSAGETRTYLTQEQVSRTGVMVNSGFEAPQPYDLNPVSLPASRFNPLTPYAQRSDFYDIAGAQFSGPFFRSRSEQGFSLRSVEPGRARIEYAGTEDGKPKLVSNLSQEITALQYRDADGALWRTPAGTRVGPGQTIPLERLEKETWPDWAMESAGFFSKSRQILVRRLQFDRHRYFAQVADPTAFALPTHPGIRWSETHLLLTGTPSGATSSGTAPTPQPDADE
ncbi:MAG TPA: hypothetical protein PLA50_20615, partial [Bacteroidia bacterium]|nr:hypothetical protein [Bacteroidia bacterium]